MAIWPFNRRKQNDAVPQEIQQYYQAERRERVGMAWLLALSTLVLTVLLVLGIFFGGRWVYRQIRDDNGGQPENVATQPADEQQAKPTPGSGQSQQSGDEEQQPPQPQSQQPTPQPQPQPQSPPATTPTPTTPQPTTPSTSEHLPRTGPQSAVAVFLAATAAGTLVHHWYTLRRQRFEG